MLFAESMIKNAKIKVERITDKLEHNKKTLAEEKVKLYSAFYDLILACEEYRLASNDYSKSIMRFILNSLRGLEAKIRDTENIDYIKEEIRVTLDLFEPINLDGNLYPNYDFRNFDVRDEVDTTAIEYILRDHIDDKSRAIKIFQPKCNNGVWLSAAKVKEEYETYGIENNDALANAAKKNHTRILKGTFEGSRISNNVFDVLINNLNFAYELDKNIIGGSVYKQEKRELNNIFRYLRDGGVGIFAIPMYRLYKDICLIFAKQLEDVQIFKGNPLEDYHDIVFIVGKKNPSKTPRTEVYDLLRSSNDYSKIKDVFSLGEFKYELPTLGLSLDIFKGSRIDEEELLDIAEHSGCMNEFFENQKIEKLSETKKQPLLPFNIGQLGIVLTSGCLDGIVDEGDGYSHLVKGRVSKKVDRDRIVDGNEVEETEIVSNRVEINILLPNGDFKTLT